MTLLKEPVKRCAWASSHALLKEYHDTEWCVPSHDDRYIFEMLTLEGAQAGLSWLTILKRRNAYQNAFHQFSIADCAVMTDEELEQILHQKEVIANRRKIYSVRANAQAIQHIQRQYGSFSAYLWKYTDDKIQYGHWAVESDVPASSSLSKQISRDLKKQGFQFVGPVIIYSFLQAIGILNDHVKTCCKSKSKIQSLPKRY